LPPSEIRGGLESLARKKHFKDVKFQVPNAGYKLRVDFERWALDLRRPGDQPCNLQDFSLTPRV